MSALPFLRRRRERRSAQRQRSQGRFTRGIIALGSLLAITLGLLIIAAALSYASITADLPSLDLLSELLDPAGGSLLQPTRIYDRSGTHLLATLAAYEGPRVYIPINSTNANHLPDVLVRATVALADPQFWKHPGCQWNGLTNPGQHPGLAQKLVSDLLLWDEPLGLRRSIRECILAAQITSHFGREKILEWYLNSTDYGHFAYGADAASRLYLGKPVVQLNMAEAALLASVGESPAINPFDAPQAALQREQDALDLILANGQARVEEINLARFIPLTFQQASTSHSSAPTFTALALSQLENRFNRARIERGGMVVLTTLEYDLQRRLDCIVQSQLTHLSGSTLPACEGVTALPPLPPNLNVRQVSASAVVLDPRTGEVLALVGDSSAGLQSSFLTPHRPGTLLTPFVYLAGFTRGLSPASLVWDVSPVSGDGSLPGAAGLVPMRVRTALVNDSLIPAGQVFEQMGAALVRKTMLPFGLDISADRLSALLETGNRYSVLQMAQTYAVFAAQGTLFGQKTHQGLEPLAVLEVRGLDGTTYVNWGLPASEQVVSPQLSYLVTDMLSTNLPNLSRPLAFKDGLTSDAAETWAVGYTPYRVVAVWMGGEGLSQRPVDGVWSAAMHSASLNVPPDGWTQPAGVVKLKVCDSSGMLPTAVCPNVVDEVFIDGNQPVQSDTLYRSYAVDTETGFLSTLYTPLQLVEKRVYMLVPPDVRSLVDKANLPVPPAQYDTLQAPLPNPDVSISSPRAFAEIHGKLMVGGTAAGADFSYYRLEYGQGLNPERWVLIGSNAKTSVKDGTLAEWDTTGLRGLYSLQLLVIHTDGSVQTSAVQVTVNNP